MNIMSYGDNPGRTPDNNVVSFINRNARLFPHKVALRWVDPSVIRNWDSTAHPPLPHQMITYGELIQRIQCVAHGLAEIGVGPGDRVIVFLPMSVWMYVALFAVQWIGGIAVFLDSWARRNHLGASAECVDPKALISHRMAFDLVATMPEFQRMPIRVIFGEDDPRCTARLEELATCPADVPIAPVEADSTALITFTTGSSGTPKGANRTHRFLASQHEALSRVLHYRDDDVDMPVFPIFSLNNMAGAVTTVLPAIDLAAPSSRDAAVLTHQIIQEGITCVTLSPSLMRNVAGFCRTANIRLTPLRRLVTGGAPISRDDVCAFREIAPAAEIWILYGSTEVEPMAHIEAREMLALPEAQDPEIVACGVNVGRISEGLRYKFIRIVKGPIELDDRGWEPFELPPGEVGEFVVTGKHVCRDYYNNPDAFRRAKIVDRDGQVWHRTGDVARLDEKGYLWVLGRVHNVIQRANRYYFPVQAEVILHRVRGIARGAFLGLPDSALGERTAAVIQLQSSSADPLPIISEVRRLFAKNGIPMDSVYVVERIPMDPRHHSKVEYEELRKHILNQKPRDYLCHDA